ncbi:MAG: histidine kinase, partial [Oscillochloris sp.]|nr:histidine kinase [Oscillochloris sp.]
FTPVCTSEFMTFASGSSAVPLDGPAVVIEIGDTGEGIPAHDLPKIFEPFYTTRIKGTGLSLALSYSIVEQHHGEIAVRSELGQGTVFRIRLPVAK